MGWVWFLVLPGKIGSRSPFDLANKLKRGMRMVSNNEARFVFAFLIVTAVIVDRIAFPMLVFVLLSH